MQKCLEEWLSRAKRGGAFAHNLRLHAHLGETLGLVVSLALATAVAAHHAQAQTPAPSTHHKSDGIVWGAAPPIFPAGAKLAVLQGDPGKAALFTVRLDLPDGYRIAPHFHPTDEYITVIQGTFLVGMGDTARASKATVLPAGGFVTAPADQHHFAIARGRTIVQVHAMGPFALPYVKPADDPSKTTQPRSISNSSRPIRASTP